MPVVDESIVRIYFPFHIWNEYFISDRLKWKPLQPLYILLLRTYKLSQVQEIPYISEYGGCKSWIDLTTPISLIESEPVVSDSVYMQLVETIQQILSGSKD